MAKKKLKVIPIDSFHVHLIDRKGNIFRREKKKKIKVCQWIHTAQARYDRKQYMRCKFRMKNGSLKFFYVQRLMMCAWRGMSITSGEVVRHGKLGSLNNWLTNLTRGDHYDNNVTDRIEQGTYLARGGNKVEDVRAIEYTHARIAEECFGAPSTVDLPF